MMSSKETKQSKTTQNREETIDKSHHPIGEP